MKSFEHFLSQLATIPDPRRAEGKLYQLPHVLLFSIFAIVSGANSYRGIRTFIKVHRPQLNRAFKIRWKRPPAHTAIRYILQGLSPADVENVFRQHAADLNHAGGRAKTDRIDGEALVRALLAYERGEPRVCAMVRVPTPEDEDSRRICRERKTLTIERIQHVNRIKGLLFSQGVSDYEPLRRNRRQRLDELKTGDGRPLPPHLKRQINRELDRLELLLGQIKAVEAERDALFAPTAKTDQTPAPQAILIGLRGIGPEFAAILWSEGLYRSFANRKQVAAYAGLAPTPWQSGSVAHEQGVSKAGNPRLRTTMIQLAWLWLRHQPNSSLAQWFNERVSRNGGRLRKTMIVALARKLLVALWKYVTAGVVIEGAIVKAAS